MRSRAMRITAIVWLLVWMGVLVPGHERGAIPLPGFAGRAPCRAASPCCPARSDRGGKPSPAPPPCAVCDFVATLTTPPPIVTVATLSRSLLIVESSQPAPLCSIDPPANSRGRAPPQA